MSYIRQNFQNMHLLTAEQMNKIDSGLADAYTELDTKQPKGDYALKTDIVKKLSEMTADSQHQTVSQEQIDKWEAKSGFSGKYEDLKGIPSDLATEDYVDEKLANLDVNTSVVLYDEIQRLNVNERTIAKNNVGIYVGTEAPNSALEGDIWIDSDANLSGATGGQVAVSAEKDWDVNDEESGKYIQNRPFWVEKQELTWDGSNTSISFDLPAEVKQIFSIVSNTNLIYQITDYFSPDLMIDGKLKISEQEFDIEAYCETENQVFHFVAENLGKNKVAIVNGLALPGNYKLSSGCYLGIIPISEESFCPIFVIQIKDNLLSSETPMGIYVFKTHFNGVDYHLSTLSFNDIKIKTEYQKFFNHAKNNIHIMSVSENISSIMSSDLSGFNSGDIILAITSDLSSITG